MITRRNALLVLGAGMFCAPLRAFGQSRVPRVGILTYGIGPHTEAYVRSFLDSMKALGYAEGQTLVIDWRRGDLSRERTDLLATELIASAPDLLLAQGYATRSLATRTKSIPIVCANSGDMVDAGFVRSLARPGTNVTGIQLLALDLVGKRLELLQELLPGVKSVAVIADPQHAGEHRERDVALKAAERLGMRVTYHPAKNFSEIDAALEAAHTAGAEALMIFPDTVTNNRTVQVADFALKHRLLTVAGWANYAYAGQLISYGPNLHASWKRLAHYADRIIKGANPAELPVEMPAVLELVVNLKTAKALGVKVPHTILLRADRVIE